jgi:hypothetical protein
VKADKRGGAGNQQWGRQSSIASRRHLKSAQINSIGLFRPVLLVISTVSLC